MEQQCDIFIADRLGTVALDDDRRFLSHLLCLGGNSSFKFNGRAMEIRNGDLAIVRRRDMLEEIRPSADFRCRIIYATPAFIELCTPRSNYGMRGSMALFLNPVIPLTEDQRHICISDFDWLESRLKNCGHRFYRDTVISAMQSAILDFFDFHANLHDKADISSRAASIMGGFLQMLDSGEYRNHREVSYYASGLCVSPKYLSEVSKKVSGHPANWWITRYTILDISRLLRNKELSFTDISDIFGFSSAAYFSRYVQQNLGVRPSELRDGQAEKP